MTPFVARAHLRTAVMMPAGPPMLDAMLMAAVALRDDLPPIWAGERHEIEIPIARERGIYLTTEGQFDIEERERRHLNRKFPMLEAQMLGSPKVRSINIKGGPCKSYRIPTWTAHLRGDVMTWFGLGDVDAVRELLAFIQYVGKKRSVGLGRVDRWEVELCEVWDGFPVLRDGRPLRPLPLDWPGLGEHRIEPRVLSPPYWERWREEECAC